MSAQNFEAALNISDDNVACKRLHELASKGIVVGSSALHATAEAFLEAFCDDNVSLRRRRWIGLALARMIEACSGVALRIRRASNKISRIGAVILGTTEAEETRIVAGLIIRSGISQGIKFSEFWAMDKGRSTESFFPKHVDARWMKQFQDYMDALSQIVITSSESQPVILYPAALHAPDGYKRSLAYEIAPLLLIEGHTLTIITPDSLLHEIEFVDVPLRSILDVRCQPSDLYDSQNRQTANVPWEVVLEFAPNSTSYEVNCSEHYGNVFTIIMEHKTDAEECMNSIKEIVYSEGNPSNTMAGLSNEQCEAISRGGIVEFNSSQRAHHTVLDASDRVQFVPAEPRTVALPPIKRTLRSSEVTPSQNTTLTGLDFPDRSPTTKRPRPLKTRKPPVSRKDDAASERSAIRSAKSNSTTLKLKPRPQSQDGMHTEDDEESLSLRTSRAPKRVSRPPGLPKVPKSDHKQGKKLQHLQSDVFRIPQEDDQGATRILKRRRVKAVTYKKGETSGEDSSGSGFAQSPQKKEVRSTRARPKRTKVREPLGSSSEKSTCNKRNLRSKAIIEQVQPLKEGSLLSNLQPKSNPQQGQQSESSIQGNRAKRLVVKARAKQKTELASPRKDVNLNSEAYVLEKLNDVERFYEPKIHISSRKRPLTSPQPTTPPHKRAKNGHDGTSNIVEIGLLNSNQLQPTMARTRVPEDPSSPCGRHVPLGRETGTMLAPPKPVIEDNEHVTSPKTRQRIGRSQMQNYERQTPVHQLARRSHTDMSASVEIFSSNSKPTPASPRAPSTAISGHADRHHVIREEELGKYKMEKSDPFQSKHQKVNEFTRRLTNDSATLETSGNKRVGSQKAPIELGGSPVPTSSQVSPMVQPLELSSGPKIIPQSVEIHQIQVPNLFKRSHSRTIESPKASVLTESPIHPSLFGHQGRQAGVNAHLVADDVEMEGDTLNELDDAQVPMNNSTSAQLRSSPPPMDHSPSSHSSTSAEPEPNTDPVVPTTSEAEEIEWESSLQPYQRNVQDQLLRVSNRVLRHIVDNESAVNDITDTYAKDGQHALQMLLKTHEKGLNAVQKGNKQKKIATNKVAQNMLSKLKNQREEIVGDAATLHQ
ncbi:hypothetical protein N0V90_003237 [Kalmusia sp. IMI 367209]|nr:hypothetical protein N0V90_003237 [Kalmusia sp. IMI 367209]